MSVIWKGGSGSEAFLNGCEIGIHVCYCDGILINGVIFDLFLKCERENQKVL